MCAAQALGEEAAGGVFCSCGLLELCLSCSWGLSMEHGAPSVPAALPYYVAFSQLLGLTVVAVTGAWLGLYRGGIAWEGSLQFNVHPLCMIIGMIFLQGDGESRGAGLPQPLLCTSVCSCVWDPVTPDVSST